jgi:hypothetical protein
MTKVKAFEFLVGKANSDLLLEEANYRTNEASKAKLFIGMSAWHDYYEKTLRELQIDFLITHS